MPSVENLSEVGRFVSLDLFRGFTVAAIILVTDLGVYGVGYEQLNHAVWDGATATEMIYPSSLVAVGISLTFSLSSRLRKGVARAPLMLHVLRRAVILILHGLLVNWYPDLDLHMIRIPCILQRIRICSLLASALYMGATGWLSARAEVGCAAGSWSEWRLFSSLAIGCY